jgi:hypothetical protein
MHGLRELQAGFRHAMLGGGGAPLAGLIEDRGLGPEAPLDIYRNNVFASLQRALKDVFPVVCRLVDMRFFAFAADGFIRTHPPERPCLFAYGDRFPDFLAQFPPCRKLVYLPDVARLEWLMNVAAHTADASPLPPAALARVAQADWPSLIFRFEPSHGLLHSPWPVARIWRSNQPGCDPDAQIDLSAGGEWLEVRRVAEDVVMRPLDAATYVLRTRLAAGDPLDLAAEAALEANPSCDFVAAFRDLFAEGLVVDIAVAPRQGRSSA